MTNYPVWVYLKVGFFSTSYGLVKYLPSPIGDWLRFAVLKLFMKRLSTVWIRDGVTIWWPERISIGKSTSLNEWVLINGYGGVEIGDYVSIGHRTTIFADEHNFRDKSRLIQHQGRSSSPIVIEDDVYLGAGVTVLQGVTISQGAVIGAGAVVTGDIPPYAIAVGTPAKVIDYRR